MKNNYLVDLHDISTDEFHEILTLGQTVKASPEKYRNALTGQTLGMIFQKPSTRTRVSFETGIFQLGGHGIYLGANDIQLGSSETMEDTAQVLSRYVDGIMARVFAHSDITTLAKFSTAPVINGLSDLLHPCQALCDYLTLREKFGELKGLKFAYVGDGNNMAHSLAYAAAHAGADCRIVTPSDKYDPDKTVVAQAKALAAKNGGKITVTHEISEGVSGVNVVYTDVWASMGQEAEAKQRLADFNGYQVDGAMFAQADSEAVFMHCLPAHRGEEVSAEVCDHKRSIIFDQAENRLHVQKAVMLLLMGNP